MDEKGVARNAKIMIAILFLAAFLWGTEALPLGATDIMVGVLIYLFAILPINEISRAYMKDAVFFIFGILAVAVGVAKTGLDKRIGLILLSRIKSAKSFAFIFLPLLAMCAGFLSEHALVALLIPALMGVYKVTCKMHGVKKTGPWQFSFSWGLFCGQSRRPGFSGSGRTQRHYGRLFHGIWDADFFFAVDEIWSAVCSVHGGGHRSLHVYSL